MGNTESQLEYQSNSHCRPELLINAGECIRQNLKEKQDICIALKHLLKNLPMTGTSLKIQWLRHQEFPQYGAWIGSLVGELRSLVPCAPNQNFTTYSSGFTIGPQFFDYFPLPEVELNSFL